LFELYSQEVKRMEKNIKTNLILFSTPLELKKLKTKN